MITVSPATTLFRGKCSFIAGAADMASLPEISRPEIAFIGRSNVGKSSLINALTGQSKLARTSQNPGHTKQLNFFLLGERLILVDMPGYGYARISKKTKNQWDKLITGYLCGRPTLQRVCLLIDARRGVMEIDEEFMEVLDDSAVNYQVIITKTDSLAKSEEGSVLQRVKDALKCHAAAHPRIIATSSASGYGISELQGELFAFAEKSRT